MTVSADDSGDLVMEAIAVVESLSATDIEQVEISLERDGLLDRDGNIMGCGPATHNF